jgi:hypothetical protein
VFLQATLLRVVPERFSLQMLMNKRRKDKESAKDEMEKKKGL